MKTPPEGDLSFDEETECVLERERAGSLEHRGPVPAAVMADINATIDERNRLLADQEQREQERRQKAREVEKAQRRQEREEREAAKANRQHNQAERARKLALERQAPILHPIKVRCQKCRAVYDVHAEKFGPNKRRPIRSRCCGAYESEVIEREDVEHDNIAPWATDPVESEKKP